MYLKKRQFEYFFAMIFRRCLYRSYTRCSKWY